MIDVIKACKIATDCTRDPYVGSIKDIGVGFIISTLDSSGEMSDVSPIIVDKQNGDTDAYFPPDHLAELKKGKNISIPEVYKYID